MTDSGLDLLAGDSNGPTRPGHRRASAPQKKPGGRKFVTIAIVIALIAAGWFAWGKASTWLNGPPDYQGQGTGSATAEVKQGDNGLDIAKMLKKADIVKSVDAFYQLSITDARAAQIQPGFYKLRKQMSSEWALRELADKGNRVEGKVVIPEGSRVGQIVTAIVKGSELTEEEVTAALDKPETLGLPDSAGNNPEGYLFPATYTIEPDATAEELLQSMVKKTLQVEQDLDIEARAMALGITKENALIVASLIEYEASREEDLAKVARVIYNRLDQDMPLQLDSTVSYVSKREGDVWTTPEERNSESEYNTYQRQGLPPGPIGSPGERTIEAALNPADGPWLYFVPINFETGETLFTQSYAEHLKNVEVSKDYCRTSEIC